MNGPHEEPRILLADENHHVYPHPHQNPLRITFDTTGLFLLSGSVLLGIHFLSPGLNAAVLLLLPLGIYVQNDYSNFLSLGPGGTPPTFWGYLRIVYLRLFTQRNPLKAPKFHIHSGDKLVPAGILAGENLPYRAGPRPTVAGIAPQRQLNQPGSLPCYHALRRSLERFSDRHTDKFSVAVSCFEKNGLALFARRPVRVTCGGEICHVHSSDKSLHLSLAPDDIGEVLHKGWGQRHPLARDQAWPPLPVPREFVMIYAPRDEDELRIVMKIIQAAAWFSTRERVEIRVVDNSGNAN